MSDSLRRIYNSIDSLFDRNSITEDLHFTKDDVQSSSSKTALQAFEKVYVFVREIDKQASLKMIVSQQGIDLEGKSTYWEFFFDLTSKRAQLVCAWKLLWDEKLDNFKNAVIEFKVTPFPPVNSPLRQMLKDGKMLNQQLASMWKQEMKRRLNLSNPFRDTNLIVKEFTQQGLDISQTEFSLSTKQVNDKTYWVAQTRDKTYSTEFV
ncbi:MAG TPA: hypothetical protein DIW23_14610 [Anaerolineae bacterium]|mgnify:CR=1 FL=1|nr:hypothetical protein [Anaerolineae bacterium]HRJ75554.1 hypothetical protein [Anaerolineales bacterium]